MGAAVKALLIDPVAQTVTPLEINDWRDISPALNCELFDIVQVAPHISIYVDDEGLYAEDQHFFYHPGYPQPLAGRGLVLGFDDRTGDSTDCPITADQLRPYIIWLGRGTVAA